MGNCEICGKKMTNRNPSIVIAQVCKDCRKPTTTIRDYRALWNEADKAKDAYLEATFKIEASFRKKHDVTKKQVSLLWLDTLLIGIEVRNGKETKVYYDSDLAPKVRK